MRNRSIQIIGGTTIVVIFILLIVVPEIQGRYFSDNVAPENVPALINEYRKTMAQVLVGGIVLAGLYFTWRRITAAEKTVEVTQEGQITERFTRAIEQLGHEKIEIRLGGIYALERIAGDSEKDYWPIIEVLTTYIRDRTSNRNSTGEVSSDIQAILIVLGRRARSYNNGEPHPLNLFNVDLEGTRFSGASLEYADLRYCNLKDIDLTRASLVNADLREVELEKALLREANLTGADLRGAHLTGADLREANLVQANLRGANLENAHLNKANLVKADLKQASVKGTKFNEVNLRGAYFAKVKHWKEIESLNLANVAELWSFPVEMAEEFRI